MTAGSSAVRRLCRDLERFQKQGNPLIAVKPSSKSMLEWHFVLHNLPESTAYRGGCYHGMLFFPERYPFAPPSLVMLTPSGRLETNQRLCLSMTDFHPESWNPAWTVESILIGLISFMVDEHDPVSFGVLHESAETRKRLAVASRAFNLANAEFCELFPELVQANPADEASAGAAASVSNAADAPLQGASPLHNSGDDVLVVSEVDETPGESSSTVAPVDDANTRNLDEGDGAAGTEDASEECWICREDNSTEPLIQPCACRGSMSGVHATCVEAWISHHRAAALGDEVPRCSVCNEPYCGTERRPGVASFARHVCGDFLRQALRSVTLVGLLVAYWTAAQPELVHIWIRVLLFAGSGAFFLYKAVVLSVSLPRGRLPPANFTRHFFTDDFRLVAVHIAEAMAIILIAALWCIYGQLLYYFFLPLCLLWVMPLLSLLVRQQSSPCSVRSLTVMAMILGSPIILMVYLVRVIWQRPQRLADPSDGLVHVVVPLVAIPLCWFCSSNMPVLILWILHSIVLLGSLIEKGTIRKVLWKEGRIWWIFMQLSVLAAYVANLLHNFSKGILKDHSSLLVLGTSAVWLALSCGLSITVNWGLCVQQYRTWQHRHGTFTISPSGSPRAGVTPQVIGAHMPGVASAVPGPVDARPGSASREMRGEEVVEV